MNILLTHMVISIYLFMWIDMTRTPFQGVKLKHHLTKKKYDIELERLENKIYPLTVIRRLYSISPMLSDVKDLLGISAKSKYM